MFLVSFSSLSFLYSAMEVISDGRHIMFHPAQARFDTSYTDNLILYPVQQRRLEEEQK